VSPIFEDEGWCVDNGKQWHEFLEKHMQATIEERTGQANALGFRSNVCRLFASARTLQVVILKYRGIDDFA
jgi:hypothetical protein